MTPSEKPQRSDEHSRQDADPTSVMTQAVDDNSASTQAKDSTEHSDSSMDSTAAATVVGDSGESSGAERSGDSDGEAPQGRSGEIVDSAEAPPPWQRASTVSGPGASEPSASPTRDFGAAGSGASAAEPEEAKAPAPDAEDTQAIPHPLRGMGQPPQADSEAAADPDAAESSHAERTTVSFAGSSSSRSSASASGPRRTSRGPRRASLQVKRLDPWSVLKLALVLSVALFFVWMIAVAVLYGVLGGMGVWDQLNGTFSELTQPENTVGEPLISAGRVFGAASIIGAVNIVLMTALATVAAFIYNVAADFAGGVEVTLSERE